MRILYLSHRIPYPLNKGEKIRAHHTLTYLAGRHEVWCVCFIDDPADAPGVPLVQQHCARFAAVPLNRTSATWRAGWRLLRGGTLTEGFFDHREMRRLIEAWSRETTFDAVLALSSSMAPYALRVPARRRVADFCDVDSRKWQALSENAAAPMSWALGIEAKRLADREIEWAKAFDAVTVISRAEADLLDRPELKRKVRVIANGMTLPDLKVPVEDGGSRAEGWEAEPASPVIGFVGDLSYIVNVMGLQWFVRRCWPRIRDRQPTARMHIIGRKPCVTVRRLARCAGVMLFADVPDVSKYLRRFTVSVAPLHLARGVQNKVLEAMAHGRAVVVTSQVGRGIEGRPGEHWLEADEPEDFAHCVDLLLTDDTLRRRLQSAGRALVEREYDWESHLGNLETLLTAHDADMPRSELEPARSIFPDPRMSRMPVSSSAPATARVVTGR